MYFLAIMPEYDYGNIGSDNTIQEIQEIMGSISGEEDLIPGAATLQKLLEIDQKRPDSENSYEETNPKSLEADLEESGLVFQSTRNELQKFTMGIIFDKLINFEKVSKNSLQIRLEVVDSIYEHSNAKTDSSYLDLLTLMGIS